MLEKYLPFLSQRAPKVPQNTLPSQSLESKSFPSESEDIPPESSIIPSEKGDSPDLLTGMGESLYVVDERNDKYIKLLQVFLLALFLVVFVLITLNSYIDKKLDSLKNDQNILVNSLTLQDSSIKELNRIGKQIATYKKAKESQVALADKMQGVLSKVTTDLVILSFRMDDKGFLISLEGPSPLSFTKLITNLIGLDTVSELSLKSATLNTSREVYTVDLGGVFK